MLQGIWLIELVGNRLWHFTPRSPPHAPNAFHNSFGLWTGDFTDWGGLFVLNSRTSASRAHPVLFWEPARKPVFAETADGYKQNQARNLIFFLHSGCGPIWIIFGGPGSQHGELSKIWVCVFFFVRKKFRIHNRNFFLRIRIFFSAKQKKHTQIFESSPCWLQVHQKLFKSARIPSDKKLLSSRVLLIPRK